MELKELERLIKMLKKHNITHYRDEKVELRFDSDFTGYDVEESLTEIPVLQS